MPMKLRVLIAMENDHRVYREVIAGCLTVIRPYLEVATVSPEDFQERLESFEPQVVICGGRNFARSEGPLVWMDLAFDSAVPLQRQAHIWLDGSCRRMPNPGIEDLISVIDEVVIARESGGSVLAADTGHLCEHQTAEADLRTKGDE